MGAITLRTHKHTFACVDMFAVDMRFLVVLIFSNTLLRIRSSYALLSCPLSLGAKKCSSLLIRPHTHIHMCICTYVYSLFANEFVYHWSTWQFFLSFTLAKFALFIFSQLFCFCLLYTLFSGSPVSRANNLCLLNLPVLVCGCSTSKGSFKLCAITAVESSLLLSIRSFLWLHCIWRVCVYVCVCIYLFCLVLCSLISLLQCISEQ